MAHIFSQKIIRGFLSAYYAEFNQDKKFPQKSVAPYNFLPEFYRAILIVNNHEIFTKIKTKYKYHVVKILASFMHVKIFKNSKCKFGGGGNGLLRAAVSKYFARAA